MSRPGRLSFLGAAALAGAALALAACDRPEHRVEIYRGPRGDRDVVRAAASDEAHDVFAKIAGAFSSRKGVRFEIVQVHSAEVLEMVEKGKADIGVTARRLVDESKSAKFSYIPIAYDGVVFLVAPETKVRELSVPQLRRILERKVKNWKEVGGADAEIRVIDRPPYSAARMAMASSLFGGRFPEVTGAFTLETSGSVFHALRNIRHYLAYATMSRTIVEQFPAVPLVVDGMAPNLSRVPFERYPAHLEYGIVFRKDVNDAVSEFLDYVSSVEGMHALASFGVAPAAGKLSLSTCHCRETEGTFTPSRKSAMAGLFTIAVVPELGTIEQEKRYSGIARLIADEIGIKTQIRHLETYDRVMQEFETGRVDAAVVGSFIYGKLHERWQVIPLARPERKGVSRYRGAMVVRAASGIRDVEGLRGRSVAYVPDTTAGELFCRLLTGAAGGPQKYFGRFLKAPSHSEALLLVADGKVDAAAVKDTVLERMTAGSPSLKAKLRAIAFSDAVPENALVVSPTLDERLRRKIAGVLLGAERTEAGRAMLKSVGADRFIPTSHEDYAALYKMVRAGGYTFAGAAAK